MKRSFIGGAALILIGILFGAVLVSGFGWVRPNFADVKIGNDKPPISSTINQADIKSFNDAFVQVAESVTKSIVQISVVSEVKNERGDRWRFFFPFDNERKTMSGGSGVIISKDGYILTNNHVVENATQVSVGLVDKRKFDAVVVGTDPLTDLAVIKIDVDDLDAAYLGDSDKIRVGEWVMAIGNPLALASTVTAGIISAKGRSLDLIENNAGVEYFIQTDAAINPGNSGGALVDLNGAVIGINTAIATNGMSSNYIGYGFAIPINLAKSVAEDLIANGKISRGYIGVSISDIDASTAKALGMDRPQGVMIQDIVEDGAASKEDIKPGDVILEIDGIEVNQSNELQSQVARKRAGDRIKLTLFRDGDKIERYVTLKAPESEDEAKPISNNKKKAPQSPDEAKEIKFENVGLSVRNLTSNEYDSYKVENGVLVTNVERFSVASEQRLFQGLVITEVNREKIGTVEEFEKIINNKKGEAVLLKVVDKNATTRIVGIDIP